MKKTLGTLLKIFVGGFGISVGVLSSLIVTGATIYIVGEQDRKRENDFLKAENKDLRKQLEKMI